jgi:hypothetical protein
MSSVRMSDAPTMKARESEIAALETLAAANPSRATTAAHSDDEHAVSTLTLGPRNANTKETRPATTEDSFPVPLKAS